MAMIERKRFVESYGHTWFVCDVHGWDFTDEDDDVCPVCLGEENTRQKTVAMIRRMNDHTTHSELCLKMHQFAKRLLEQLGEDYDAR